MPKRTPLKVLPPIHKLIPSLRDKVINIALVGCGGNGSQMLTKLARLDHALRELGQPGFHVYAFDPDTVSRANVGRQLFSPSDVGLHKCVVLVNRINAYYGTAWTAYPMKYEGQITSMLGPGTYTNPDLLITCVDTARARRQIHNFMSSDSRPVLLPTYWLDLGNKKSEGQVILGQPASSITVGAVSLNASSSVKSLKARDGLATLPRLPIVTEVFPELLDARRKEDDTPSCSLADALAAQSLFINDALSTWAIQLLDDLLRGGSISYHGVFVNLETGKVNPLPVPVAKPSTQAVAA